MPRLLLLALGFLTLTACETEDTIYINVPAETKDWMPDQNDQPLTFATASGATQTMLVERSTDSYDYTGKGVTVLTSTEWHFARYKQKNTSNPGFSLAGHEFWLHFLQTEKPVVQLVDNQADELGGITTNDSSPHNGYAGTLSLKNNQAFGGHTYPALVTVDFTRVDTLTAPATVIRKIYYAKSSGLVGYRTANGQLWLRQ